MKNLVRKHYGEVQIRTASERSIELEIFQKITHQLEAADPSKPEQIVHWADALNQNAALWNVLFIDVTSPENKLEESLKRQLATLAVYVQRATQQVLQGAESISDLIEINHSIILGLKAQKQILNEGIA